MAGRASNAAGRLNVRFRGRLRGAAALSDSQLLGRLLEDLVDVFDAEVLPLLDPTTRALLGRVGQACRDAVLRFPKLPCAGPQACRGEARRRGLCQIRRAADLGQ
jgi:hypothetical protein